jgi:chromosome segregation ATPase
MTQTNQAAAARTSKRDTTALVLLGAMFIALAMIGSASLSAVGPSAFQDLVNAIGFGRSTAIEAEQRRQAAVLEALGDMVHTVSADVGSLSSRARVSDQNEVAVSDRFSLLDADIAALVAEIRSLRASSSEASEPASVIRVDNDLDEAKTDILALRSSFDAHEQAYRNDMAAVNKDMSTMNQNMAAMNKRIDRLEQMINRDYTSAIRTQAQVRRSKVRRIPRGVSTVRVNTSRNNSAASTAAQATYLPDRPY